MHRGSNRTCKGEQAESWRNVAALRAAVGKQVPNKLTNNTGLSPQVGRKQVLLYTYNVTG